MKVSELRAELGRLGRRPWHHGHQGGAGREVEGRAIKTGAAAQPDPPAAASAEGALSPFASPDPADSLRRLTLSFRRSSRPSSRRGSSAGECSGSSPAPV